MTTPHQAGSRLLKGTLSIKRAPSVGNWLSEFVGQRGLHTAVASDGLYQFHMTEQEYAQLQSLLRSSTNFAVKNTFSKEWCGAFVLFGAEWFRREYTRDWSWQPIFQRLGFELSAAQVSDVVTKGITGYWKRPLAQFSANHNDYLGSVFCQGGLPSNLLSSDIYSAQGNHYQDAFFAIFERYHEAKALGKHAIESLISNRISTFPETLQRETTVNLIANMVDKLDALVYQFELDNKAHPAEHLDEQFPRWRESFPLPLEGDTGSTFLSQLLAAASKEVKKVTRVRKELQCHHLVSFVNQSITTQIRLPHECHFDIDKSSVTSSRIELAIYEADKQIASMGVGFGQFDSSARDSTTKNAEKGMLVRMRNPVAEVRRSQPNSELYIVVLQAGCRLAEIRLPNSSVDVGESPITLFERGDQWTLLSQSTVTTNQSNLALIAPQDSSVDVVYGKLELAPFEFKGLAVYYLEGQCEVTVRQNDISENDVGTNERYRITSSSNDFDLGDCQLKGEQLAYKTNPPLVFKGFPMVSARHQSELCTNTQLDLFLNNASLSTLDAPQRNGSHLLTVKDDRGLVQLKKRIGIVPRDFDIDLQSGDKPNQGVIRLRTQTPFAFKFLTEGVECVIASQDGGMKELNVSVLGKPPAKVTLALQLSTVSKPITIEVPFPTKGAVAYNKTGKPLAPRLSVDDLLGSRLVLFSTQGMPATFQLEAVLTGKGRKEVNRQLAPYFRWSYKVTKQPVEVSLYGIKGAILELLSMTEGLDSEVELRVTGPGRTLSYVVSHFATELDHNRTENTVGIRSTTVTNYRQLTPVVMSLANPEQKPIPLVSRTSEGVEIGEYDLPEYIVNAVDGHGPWLVVPDVSSDVAFRAKFFAGSSNHGFDHTQLDKVQTLQKASQMFHPRFAPNVIGNVIAQMTDDWAHSGWHYLKATKDNYRHLPMSTFEVWRHLVRNNKALAVALFRMEFDLKWASQFETELPLLWEQVAISDWQHAISLFKATLITLGIDEAMVEQVAKQQVDKLGDAVPALNDDVIKTLLLKGCTNAIPAPMAQAMLHGWYQSLLHTHSEDNDWPTEFGHEFRMWCQNLTLIPFDFKPNAGFQSGVVYWPIVAAAIACKKVPNELLATLPVEAIFHLRKLRDFDRDWFEPVYRLFITILANRT
ncbi:TPA: STY4851/ECs_5259 family protein [Vibrio vulnificus]